MLFGNMYFITC